MPALCDSLSFGHPWATTRDRIRSGIHYLFRLYGRYRTSLHRPARTWSSAGKGDHRTRATASRERLLSHRSVGPSPQGGGRKRGGRLIRKMGGRNTLRTGRRGALLEATLSRLRQKATDPRSQCTREWIRSYVNSEQRYRPPKDLRKEGEGVVSKVFQLLSGYAVIGSYLKDKTKTTQSDKCWWCGRGERQSRHHLFVKCQTWATQIEELWKDTTTKIQ